jgi:hypothetical protein
MPHEKLSEDSIADERDFLAEKACRKKERTRYVYYSVSPTKGKTDFETA